MVYWHLLDQAHLVTGDHEASVVVLVGDVEVGLVLAQVADNVQPALCVWPELCHRKSQNQK